MATQETFQEITITARSKTAQALPSEKLDKHLVTLDEAVKISGISSRAIYRLIEEGRIHFVETADGGARICPATLLKRVWKEQDG